MDSAQQGSRALAPVRGLGGQLRRAGEFLVAVRAEMGKVSWPTRAELVKATRMILILAVVLGLIIGWLDLLLQLILVDGVAQLSR
jgi:preprotein translocase subunit SecE